MYIYFMIHETIQKDATAATLAATTATATSADATAVAADSLVATDTAIAISLDVAAGTLRYVI